MSLIRVLVIQLIGFALIIGLISRKTAFAKIKIVLLAALIMPIVLSFAQNTYNNFTFWQRYLAIGITSIMIIIIGKSIVEHKSENGGIVWGIIINTVKFVFLVPGRMIGALINKYR
jgi:uncharacterized membrane protein (DUF441 family)